ATATGRISAGLGRLVRGRLRCGAPSGAGGRAAGLGAARARTVLSDGLSPARAAAGVRAPVAAGLARRTDRRTAHAQAVDGHLGAAARAVAAADDPVHGRALPE